MAPWKRYCKASCSQQKSEYLRKTSVGDNPPARVHVILYVAYALIPSPCLTASPTVALVTSLEAGTGADDNDDTGTLIANRTGTSQSPIESSDLLHTALVASVCTLNKTVVRSLELNSCRTKLQLAR